MKAHYHQTGKPPVACEAKKNDDGTVDLSVDGKLIVTGCPVSNEPLDGHATLVAEEKKAKDEGADKKPADDKGKK